MSANKRGGKREGAGRPPLSPEELQMHATVRLTPAQIEQLKGIGNGNLSEGIRRLLSRYEILIALWRRNVKAAQNALAAAKHFDADMAPFEGEVAIAQGKVEAFTTEYEIVRDWLHELEK